jgi:hypothetical protein
MRPRRPCPPASKVTTTVHAHGDLGEKAAALTQLGNALSAGLSSPVVVDGAPPPRRGDVITTLDRRNPMVVAGASCYAWFVLLVDRRR